MEEAIASKRAAEREQERGASSHLLFDGASQREYLMAKEIVGDVSLVDVAMFYRDHKERFSEKPSPVDLVAEAVLASIHEGDVTKRYLWSLKACFCRFTEHFKGRQLSSITQNEVLNWIRGLGFAPATMRSLARKTSFLFKRAKQLGYLKTFEPFEKSLLPKESNAPVLVYSIDEMAEILRYTHENAPDWLPNIALRCFVGLRTSEASKMRWEWIDMKRKRILIPAEICKTRDDWVLQSPNLPETVFEWLDLVPQEKRSGKIPAPPDRLGSIFSIPLKKNGFRHTFCTMHISLYGSADKTATLLKHKGTSMLYQHYLGKLVPEEEARAYFALTPQSLSSESA